MLLKSYLTLNTIHTNMKKKKKKKKKIDRVPAGSLWKKNSPVRGLETNIFFRLVLLQNFVSCYLRLQSLSLLKVLCCIIVKLLSYSIRKQERADQLRFPCPTNKYKFRVNNRNTRKRYEIRSKLTIKATERCQ